MDDDSKPTLQEKCMSLVPLRLMASFVCSVTMLFALDAVTVDANGNMVLGTDPQAGDSEILRTEGVLRAANVLSGQTPVAISAATTLTATAFGNWHLVSGTTADFTITLPSAVGNQGKCLGVRVLDATLASKNYTVAAAGTEKIDSAASVVLAANGALVLMSDGARWARIGGTATTVHVEASNTTAQAITGGVTNLQYSVEAVDTHSAWNGAVFTAPVGGIYMVSAAVVHNAGNHVVSIYRNGVLYRSGQLQANLNNEASISTSIGLLVGDTVSIRDNASATRSTNASGNWLSITRIGD